eukprot:gene1413-2711_t
MNSKVRNPTFFRAQGSTNQTVSISLQKILRNARATGSLNLSSQAFDEIPNQVFDINETIDADEKFWELNDLVFLKLRNNKLKTITDDLYSLKLKHLDLSNNQLTEISPCIGQLTELKELLLFSNLITILPPEISYCQSLQLLECRRNQLRRFPDVSHLNSLTFLDLGENRISEMPVLPAVGTLGRLHLNNNQLSSLDHLDRLLCCSSTLAELHLQSNKLKVIPAEMAYLSSLKVLDVGANDISDIPAALGYMNSLQRLILDGNPLRTIRRSMGMGASQGGGNGTMELKKFLRTRGPPLGGSGSGDMSCEDDGDGMGHSGSGSDIMEMAMEGRMRSCQSEGGTLDLSKMKLSTIPLYICNKFTSYNVKVLNLTANGLLYFPNLSSLLTLKALDVSSNNLGHCDPKEVMSGPFPPSLSSLNISTNFLTDVHFEVILNAIPPDCLLTVMKASHNSLTRLPASLQRLHLLTELQLANNQIRELNLVDWSEMRRLESLDLSGNKLDTLSVQPLLATRTYLTSLSLDNNDIQDIPPEFALFSRLRHLGIYGNPQRSIRTTVMQQGTEAILKVLRNRLPPETLQQQQTDLPTAPSRGLGIGASGTGAGSNVGRISSAQSTGTVPSTARTDRDDNHAAAVPSTSFPMTNGNDDNALALMKLESELGAMKLRLENECSLTETAKFALKKEIAKKRANILRLSRGPS